ncbi:excalibur calcium-binding domain-containing protein [Actinomadura rubrisoli]|uniref:excalibur calcium-binding domain-containing protein n=1 Tax=Actinomadura rubrisoli TaxID=2530368 RepID=UPI001A9E3B1D|nr:excalibur calcium-binding domain-containing protein [Actinomadura rubrisoli]
MALLGVGDSTTTSSTRSISPTPSSSTTPSTEPSETFDTTSGPTASVQPRRRIKHPTETPKPKPRVSKRRAPRPPAQEPVYYSNCAAVRAAGKAPIHAGEPGYARHLDRDGDGVGCE